MLIYVTDQNAPRESWFGEVQATQGIYSGAEFFSIPSESIPRPKSPGELQKAFVPCQGKLRILVPILVLSGPESCLAFASILDGLGWTGCLAGSSVSQTLAWERHRTLPSDPKPGLPYSAQFWKVPLTKQKMLPKSWEWGIELFCQKSRPQGIISGPYFLYLKSIPKISAHIRT